MDALAHAPGASVFLRAPLKKLQDGIRSIFRKNEEKLLTERARSDGLRAEVTEPASQVMKVEELLCMYCPKERMDLIQVKNAERTAK